MTFDTALAGIGHRCGQHQRRCRPTRSSQPRRPDEDAGRGAEVARLRESARRRLRHSERRRRPFTPTSCARSAIGVQRRRLPAGDAADERCREAVGRARRALRSPRSRRRRQLARGQERRWAESTSAPTTTRREPPRCSRSASGWPRRRGSGTCCCSSGRAKSSGCSARPPTSTSPPVPLDQLAAYVNFDMVGRMQDNKLTVQATGTSRVWGRLHRAGQRRRRLRSAAAAGSLSADRRRELQPGRRARALNFFTGTHTDYHRPSDTADKINYEDLDRIVDFAAAIVSARCVRHRRGAAFTKVEQATETGAASRRPRVHRHDSGLLHRGEGAAAERRHRRRPGRSRRACRKATSSWRSPGRRSPTSTTTPTRSKC